jgi:transposase InsO family protein
MIKTIKEERLRWVLPIVNKKLKLREVALLCPHGKRSLERWVAMYRHGGEEALVPRSTRPKTNPKETRIDLKERVIEMRKNTGLCAKKIMWKLGKEGIDIHERTVGKILRAEGLVRTYRLRKVKMKYVKVPLLPGEIMEIDVKYVPESIGNKAYFQYTAIDCASRWRYLSVYDAQSSLHSIRFLREVLLIFPHRIRAVKTDNGAIFTNYYLGTNKRSDMSVKQIHAFDTFCAERRIIHYLIDPGKPAQNGKVERSHREDQEKFYEQHIFLSYDDLKHKLAEWNMYYNNLEHCGLDGQTPNEYLTTYVSLNPPDVCT